MASPTIEDIVNYLSKFVLEERINLMKDKLSHRTSYLTICLENIYQSQNASAVLRSAEAFGIQNVHIVESINQYNVNPDIALGSDKWINIQKHNSAENLVETLRNKGFRIIATTPKKEASSLEEFDLSAGKAAIFFGTELTGLSDYVIDNADEYLYIPMHGFVESLNVSVSAAVTMYTLTRKLRESSLQWTLSNDEKNVVLLDWLKKVVRLSDKIINHFCENF